MSESESGEDTPKEDTPKRVQAAQAAKPAKPTTGAKRPSDREIVTTRVVNAPRDRVFEAWTDPKLLAQWWGPKGFTNTFEVFELRPGGVWRFVMHGPDGRNYPNKSVFAEIKRPERLVFNHESAPQFHVTVSFVEKPGKTTKITAQMLFATAALRDAIATYAVDANEQNFDRLEALLAKPP